MRQLAATLTLLLVLSAQPSGAAPKIRIGSPSHGDDFTAVQLNADDELPIIGFTDVAFAQIGVDYYILVMGRLPNFVGGAPNGGTIFRDDVSVGPQPPTWNNDVWPAWYPFLNTFREPRHILKPILVELYDIHTSEVVARDRIVLFDRREDVAIVAQSTRKEISDGFGVQLTPAGLDDLEIPHLATLPRPDLPALNDELAGLVGPGIPATLPFEKPLPCFPLDKRWKKVDAYKTAKLAAQAAYTTYKATKKAANTAAGAGPFGPLVSAALSAAAERQCVKKRPKLADFEVCAARLDGLLERITVGAVDDADLAIGAGSPQIDAGVTLTGIDGVADAFLRGLEIRWVPGDDLCVGRPMAAVDEREIAQRAWLDAWATCEDLDVDAARARMLADQEVQFMLSADPADGEQLVSDRTRAGSFTLLGTGVDVRKGLCSDPEVETRAAELAESYFAWIGLDVTMAWDAGQPKMQHAQALDLLLDGVGFELGTYEPTDHALRADFTTVETVADEGLRLSFETDTETRSIGAPVVAPPWTYRGAEPMPWSHDGRSLANEPFDLAFSITTGHLNQVIRALAPTERLTFTASWAELGFAPPGGARPEEPALLDGQALAAVYPALADIGADEVEVRVAPTLTPFTWMPPDTIGLERPGELPIIYSIGQLELKLVEPDTGFVWLHAIIDLYDDEFSVELDPEIGSPRLRTGFGNELWGIGILDEQLPSCAMEEHAASRTPDTCDDLLPEALYAWLAPLLAPRFEGLLDELPAPQFFDAGGKAPRAQLQLSPLEPWHEGQNIVLYGRLPDTPVTSPVTPP